MIKIGITGGIGSGKSIVSELFRLYGIPVYIADNESKRLTVSSPVIRKALISRFGEALYANDKLNKEMLAFLIFSDEENLRFVNGVIHPVVLQDFTEWVQKQPAPWVAMETAILFESGFYTEADVIITVIAPLDKRIDRVMKRDHASRSGIQQRINIQMSDEEKCKRSHFVLINDEKRAIIPQIESIIKRMELFAEK